MDDKVVLEIQRKIDRERAVMNGAERMRASSSNAAVQAQADGQIKEGRKNIEYLEGRLQALRLRMDAGGPTPPAHGQGAYQPPGTSRGGNRSSRDDGGYGGPAQGDYQDQLGAGTGMMPPRAPYGPSVPNSATPKARPNYSKLGDLIKADTQHLGPRFQLQLSQLTFKLTVERQYLKGIEKLSKLSAMQGDNKQFRETEARRLESSEKIRLLSTALRRYEDLHIDMVTENAEDGIVNRDPTLLSRKPLTGQLMIKIHAIKDVNHLITGRFSGRPETFVVMKVEDVDRIRTKITKNDRWLDEQHFVDVDKANELELTVCDRSGGSVGSVGIMWVRLSDIVEEMRRKKIEAELSGTKWMTAEQMEAPGGGPNPQYSGQSMQGQPGMRTSGSGYMQPGPGSPGMESIDPNAVDAWFALEPVGAIRLTLSFVKQNRGKANFDAGLNRKGAVRQRKEEVQEQYGHKFVLQQFYSIMRCALCGEFLKYAAGMQCSDCKYTCHQKCFTQVVTKCISKSNAETDPDEEKINHRIPHRFEPWSNIGANWCCHCGYILPFGKKNSKRCSECGLTVHTSCAHLVPDFCGMPMNKANELLRMIKTIPKKPPPLDHGKGALSEKTLRTGKSTRPEPKAQPSWMPQSPQQESKPSLDRPISYSAESSSTQGRYSQNYVPEQAAISAAPQSPRSPKVQERPAMASRTPTDLAAAAAAASYTASQQSSTAGRPNPRVSQSAYDTRQSGSSGPPQIQQPQQPPHARYDPAAYAGYTTAKPQAPAQAPMMTSNVIPAKSVELAQQPPSQPVPEESQQGSGRRIGLEHFNFLAVLGKGNFGKVMLAETKTTKKLYAIKVLKKEFIIENDEVESTRSEKRVFLIANKERHPFLLNLHACFQTETRVYFVMEYISGGDLMLHIQRGNFGLKRAQFYAAEVCLALKYFHEHGVIYRDLKLDNIMLALDGHVRVGDYGLCKENMYYGDTTGTFCGTPEFMAPEILLDKKYGRAVDWWAFGVLIYQMLLQQSPFRGEDEDEIYDAILADEPLYPIHMPRDSVSILQKLLTREPELRLGSGPTDAQEIMSHAFFRNVNWEDIRAKKVPPPFMPSIKNPTDTSNFDSEFTSVTPVLTPVQSVLTQAMQEEFRGFSYSADFI